MHKLNGIPVALWMAAIMLTHNLMPTMNKTKWKWYEYWLLCLNYNVAATRVWSQSSTNIVRVHCSLFSSNNFIRHARAFHTRATEFRRGICFFHNLSHTILSSSIQTAGPGSCLCVCVCSLRTVVVCLSPCVSIAFNWRGCNGRSVFVCLFRLRIFRSASVAVEHASHTHQILLWFAHKNTHSALHLNQIVGIFFWW